MTVMSVTPARFANSSFVHPLMAMSSAISCALNRTGDAGLLGAVDIVSRSLRAASSRCQQHNADNVNNFRTAVLGCNPVAGRPVFHKEFGQYLIGLRNACRWSQSDAARFAKQQDLGITRQMILHLEKGKTKDPAPQALRDMAVLYGTPYEMIVWKFIECRYGLERTARHEQKPEGIEKSIQRSSTQQEIARVQLSHSNIPESETPSLVATVAVRSSDRSHIVKSARKLYRYAAAVSAVADSLMHSFAAVAGTRVTQGSRRSPRTPSRTGGHAGGRKR